ncbi:hypothetical protein AKJ44_02750 [candidate division MSBL1 archaeon SCGC-AAA261F17]|uniref:HAD family hydrolase n=1 Tax=candidate division MSBL1 archaeon SCGC-AAA261F17 TaxID=1698274 RepID=A0A133V474_9EURY|nr:hypothetical protein AKJ44_02750 [candidate division MSBL1 archaeon SCGC-AAA261F17]
MLNASAAIFDTDGTLIDTTKRFYTVFCSMIKERGQEPLEWSEFFKHYSEDTLDEIISREAENREEELRDFWLEFLKRYRSIPIPDDSLIEDADVILEKISDAGVKIAVTTSCILPPPKLEEELEDYGLMKHVDVVVTGENVIEDLVETHHFSKREIFEVALSELEVKPEDSVIIGDYWNDMKAGKELGAKTIAVLTGDIKPEILEDLEPDAILESVGDLFSVVKFSAT